MEVLNACGVDRFVAVGSLMGCYFVASLASRYPHRVVACAFTNLYWAGSNATASAKPDPGPAIGTPIPDSWQIKSDGSHLTELFTRRSAWLDPLLNTRVVRDQLVYLLNRKSRYEKGIWIEDASAYDLSAKARRISCPTLCIRGEMAAAHFDKIGLEGTSRFAAAEALLNQPETLVLKGSGSSVNLVNQQAVAWAEAIVGFVRRQDGDETSCTK